MRSKSLLMVLMLCLSGVLTGVVAQVKVKALAPSLTPGTEYLIYDAFNTGQNRTGFRFVASGSTTISTAYNLGDPSNYDLQKGAIWKVEGDAVSGYAFKNRVTGQYFNGTNTAVDTRNWTVLPLEDATEAQFTQPKTDYLGKSCYIVYDGGTYWNGNVGGMATWSTAHPYQFYTFTEEKTAKITYHCVGPNGEELKTAADEVKINSQYILKAPSIAFYQLVSKSYNGAVVKNDTIKEVGADMTIECLYKEYLPFQVTNMSPTATEFPADAKFYRMTIHANKYYIEYSPTTPNVINPIHSGADYFQEIIPDSALWCFVGNRTDGFRLYNRAAGPQKILYTEDPEVADPDDAGTVYPHMVSINDVPEGAVSTWDIYTGAFADGFLWAYGGSENCMNKRGNNLTFWQGGADGGSTFTFQYFNAQTPYVQMLTELLGTVTARVKTDSANVGNPGFTSEADFNTMYVHYSKAKADTVGGITNELAQADFIALKNAFNLYKTQRNDKIEEGVAYFMANTSDRGRLYFDSESSDIFVWSSGRAGAGAVDSLNACWSVIKSDIDGEYYLYNIGRKQYIRYAEDLESTYKISWRFSSVPCPVTIGYEGNGFVFKAVEDVSKALSISNSYAHPIITYYAAGDGGVAFGLRKKGQMTAEEIQTAKDVLAAGERGAGLTDAWSAQGTLTSGASAKNVILSRTVVVGNANEPTSVTGMKVNLENASAVTGVKVYATTTSYLSGVADDKKMLLAQPAPAATMDITFDTQQAVEDQPVYLWVVADLSSAVNVEDKINASVESVKYDSETITNGQMTVGNSSQKSSVMLYAGQTSIFDKGTLKSNYFGSPVITKAPNGDLLAVADVRYNSAAELGSHQVDIALSRSTDKGVTWTAPVIILKGDSATDAGFGYSSPSVAVDKANGLIKILVSGGKKAIGDGNKNLYLLTSTDNGATWSTPKAITVLWEMSEKGQSYSYLASMTGKGLVLENQPEESFYGGSTVFPVRTNIAGKTYTYAISELDGVWLLSNSPVFNSVQNTTLQETAEGVIVATASTSRKDGARLRNVWEPSSVSEETAAMIFGDETVLAVTGSSNAAGLAVTEEGTTILTNIALNTSKLMLNVSDDDCENWGTDATKVIQGKHARVSSIVDCGDNSICIFYETRVVGAPDYYTLTSVKVPYSYFQSIITNIGGVESDKVQQSKDENYYDLQGRRVTPAQKGVYVTKGKKVVVK